MTDFRARCAELVELDQCEPGEYDDWREKWIAAINRAKAALAQPNAQVPTDKELLELMPESVRDEFSYSARVCSDALGRQVKPDIFRVALNLAALEYARAVLARWGGSAPCPHVVSSDEGTSYCRLAEHTADQLAKLIDCGHIKPEPAQDQRT